MGSVAEAWLQKHNKPVLFHVAGICRYDAAAGRWQRLPQPDPRRSTRLVPLSSEDASRGDRVAFELPQETALFWLQWGEQNELNRSSRSSRFRDALVTSGPMLCNDIDLGPAPPDQVAACVPYADRAHVPKRASCSGPRKRARGEAREKSPRGVRGRRACRSRNRQKVC